LLLPEASRMGAMQTLWQTAGLQAVETREITVQRTFADFDDIWTGTLASAATSRLSRRCLRPT